MLCSVATRRISPTLRSSWPFFLQRLGRDRRNLRKALRIRGGQNNINLKSSGQISPQTSPPLCLDRVGARHLPITGPQENKWAAGKQTVCTDVHDPKGSRELCTTTIGCDFLGPVWAGHELSGKKKAHKHKLFCPVGPSFHRNCPRDKPSLSLEQIR